MRLWSLGNWVRADGSWTSWMRVEKGYAAGGLVPMEGHKQVGAVSRNAKRAMSTGLA
jgi:hypothetical protein